MPAPIKGSAAGHRAYDAAALAKAVKRDGVVSTTAKAATVMCASASATKTLKDPANLYRGQICRAANGADRGSHGGQGCLLVMNGALSDCCIRTGRPTAVDTKYHHRSQTQCESSGPRGESDVELGYAY